MPTQHHQGSDPAASSHASSRALALVAMLVALAALLLAACGSQVSAGFTVAP